MPVARRGEIWLVDLGFAAKVRPALVLSVGFGDQDRAIVTFVPRTTAIRGTRFEVRHAAPGFDAGVFDAQGISGAPEVKLIRKLAVADVSTLESVEAAVKAWLGLA